MAAWLIPALKAVLPHVGSIIDAARPVFTGRKADAAANQTALLQQQIADVQTSRERHDRFASRAERQIELAA